MDLSDDEIEVLDEGKETEKVEERAEKTDEEIVRDLVKELCGVIAAVSILSGLSWKKNVFQEVDGVEVSDEVTEQEEDDDECMIVGEETVKRVGDDFPMVSFVS